MEDINKENLPKNAKKENPTEEELVDRLLKKEAMAKYRKRLKEGKVDGPVNKYGQIIQQVNTQIDHNIIEYFREKLKTLNKENETNFTSSEMLSHILKTWNVSNVKNMNFMFADSLFCGDISEWNVEKVETMTGMFLNKYFYGDINNWKPYSLGKIKVENIIKNKNYKVPYWMKYEKKEERLIAIKKYILEQELSKEKIEVKQKVKVKI